MLRMIPATICDMRIRLELYCYWTWWWCRCYNETIEMMVFRAALTVVRVGGLGDARERKVKEQPLWEFPHSLAKHIRHNFNSMSIDWRLSANCMLIYWFVYNTNVLFWHTSEHYISLVSWRKYIICTHSQDSEYFLGNYIF